MRNIIFIFLFMITGCTKYNLLKPLSNQLDTYFNSKIASDELYDTYRKSFSGNRFNHKIIDIYYTKDNKKIVATNKNSKFIYEYMFSIECSGWMYEKQSFYRYKKDNCRLQELKFHETYDSLDIDLYYNYRKKQVKKLFETLYAINKQVSIFRNKKRQIIKSINYKRMEMKYYYYDKQYTYEVICNYLNKECLLTRL